jgi:hypothetical protein
MHSCLSVIFTTFTAKISFFQLRGLCTHDNKEQNSLDEANRVSYHVNTARNSPALSPFLNFLSYLRRGHERFLLLDGIEAAERIVACTSHFASDEER